MKDLQHRAAALGPMIMRSLALTGSILMLIPMTSAAAATVAVPFSLDGGTPALMLGQGTPLDQTTAGLTAHFSSPNDGAAGAFSIQNSLSTGFRLSQFSGNFLYANTNKHYALDIRFSRPITSITLTFATMDYLAISDVPADLQLTAYVNSTAGTPVGAVLKHADYGTDTYPTSTITFGAGGAPFNLVELIVPPNPAGTNAFMIDHVVAVTTEVNAIRMWALYE